MTNDPQDPRLAVLFSALLHAWAVDDRPSGEDSEAILAALDAVDPARRWKDIADAPRDGTWGLVSVPTPPPGWIRAEPYVTTAFNDEHWGDGYWLDLDHNRIDPTHFLPLPEPPEE